MNHEEGAMRRLSFALATFAVVTLTGSRALAADPVSSKLDFHVANGFIQVGTGGIPQTGAVATASENGHQVRVSGSGTFNVKSMNATGNGTFVHTSETGVVLGFGTWTATGLESAVLYPCGIPGVLPDNFCGGVIVVNVTLTGTSTSAGVVQFGAVLTIDCEINPPTPGIEGIKLEIPGLVDFDTTEFSDGGLTVFVSRNR
jgi:hypothetical protein